jgi:hypothetical protein
VLLLAHNLLELTGVQFVGNPYNNMEREPTD